MTLAVFFLLSNKHYLTFIENFLKEKLEGLGSKIYKLSILYKNVFYLCKSTESSEIYPKIIK